MDYDDPGWESIVKRISLGLIPVIGPLLILRRRQQADGLTAIRFIYAGIVLALWLVPIVLLFIVPTDRWFATDRPGWLVAVVAAGVISLAFVQWTRSRPLDATSPGRLAATYRGTFFIGIGVAEASALVGFVATVVSDSLWPYFIGLAFSTSGLLLVGPSKREITRRQEQVQAQGSPLSLGRVLMDIPSSS
jgi:hypothetical protein